MLNCHAVKYLSWGCHLTLNRPLSRGGHFVSGFKKLCLCTASLVERTRLAMHKQCFLNLLRQNGRCMTKVYIYSQASPFGTFMIQAPFCCGQFSCRSHKYQNILPSLLVLHVLRSRGRVQGFQRDPTKCTH